VSLLVWAYRRDADGRMIDLDIAPVEPRNDLAGFESWRWKVYGSAPVRALGLRLIPSLATGDIYAEDDEVDVLAAEIETLLRECEALAVALDVEEEGIRFRVENMREAVRLARTVEGGCVCIS